MSLDRDKLRYSIFCFPGTGGHVVSWLLALTHEHLLLPKALECFPLELKYNHKTIRDKENIPIFGWSFHENATQLYNPYCKVCFLYTSQLDGYIDLDSIHKIIKMASKHTTNIFLLMSNKARTRACFEKGTRPFRTHDKITIEITREEKKIYKEKKLKIIREFDEIDYLFNYNSIFQSPERCIGEIETLIDHSLTNAHVEAIEKLVNRYKQITPPKLLKIINNENKLS